MDRGILPKGKICQCGASMKLLKREDVGDGARWRCPKRACRKSASIRTDTVFFGSKLSLTTIMQNIYSFAGGLNAKDCHWMVRPNVSYGGVLTWYRILRNVMSQALIEAGDTFRFDASDLTVGAVEVHESWFGKKAKNGKGTSRQTHLVFWNRRAQRNKMCIEHGTDKFKGRTPTNYSEVRQSQMITMVCRHTVACTSLDTSIRKSTTARN